MSKVIVSIVCTNYNKGDWIAEAIESFLRQKANFEYEILLIDDKSADHSKEIIKKYAKKYPEKIRAFYNKKNLGITRTWIKICKEAKGKYIARCDGDDYWIDENKLQRQVDALEKNNNSSWSCTDYDIVNPEGKVIHGSAVESGYIQRPKSYAEMLATKGFTMSSTWLVDSSLMKEINTELNQSAVDDTFNIQLELFNKTTLSYLPKTTTAYRFMEGSDSHPIAVEKTKLRNKKLLETQLEYIKKYRNVSYLEIIKILLHKDIQNEITSTERLQLIERQGQLINQQEVYIKKLEKNLTAIVESRSYKLATKMQNLANIPRKVTRRKNK